VARAPNSDDYRSWEDLILVRSRRRPRDAIQLINLLAQRAISLNAPKIMEDHFRAIMPSFSEGRATLFGQEVESECPRALEIVRSFAQLHYPEGGFRLTADEAKSHLRKIASQFGISIYGKSIRPDVEDDVFEIWRFLYLCHVLNARVSDSTEKEGYRHLNPEDDPMLPTKARWNEMQKMLWEINPAFRDYLVAQQSIQSAQTGLPRRPSRRRR
jgi:hypothetical protein